MWKCSPENQGGRKVGVDPTCGAVRPRSKVPLNMLLGGVGGGAEDTVACVRVCAGCLRSFITVYPEPDSSSTCDGDASGTVPLAQKVLHRWKFNGRADACRQKMAAIER